MPVSSDYCARRSFFCLQQLLLICSNFYLFAAVFNVMFCFYLSELLLICNNIYLFYVMFYYFCVNIYLFTSTCICLHQYTFVCSCPLWATVNLFSGATLYFLLALLFAGYSPFCLCPSLFAFVFLSPYSAYFVVLSNFLSRFSGLALRRLLVAFCGRSFSLYPAYFHLEPSLLELEL